MFFKKKKKNIPSFTFYEQKDDTNFIQSKQQQRFVYAENALIELNQLIGLEPIKKWVKTQQAIIEANRQRENAGIYIKNNFTMHMVFYGNPGTGKTETARLLGRIYYGLGILPTESFLEVSRRELVGDGYASSAEKVNKVFQEALGGILFIDEAYSVCYSQDDQQGKEAVDTLLKLMEDYRDSIMVIMAGYTKEMNSFLQMNPGFESRIPPNNKVIFADYTIDDMISIFKIMTNKKGLRISSDVSDDIIKTAIINMSKTNGNARDVRNLVDKLNIELDKSLHNNYDSQSNDKDCLVTLTKSIVEGL